MIQTADGFVSIRCRELGVDAAQPIGHSLQQGIPKSGDLGQCVEFTWSNDEQLQIRERGDGGAARAAVQGPQLPEEVAGTECVDPSTCLNDLDGYRRG